MIQANTIKSHAIAYFVSLVDPAANGISFRFTSDKYSSSNQDGTVIATWYHLLDSDSF